ncbi:MAG: GNAT family N-acetyltransferase [Anaerolineae bacterium]|nr:GNAT family N-acetyltransferase [Phycisphaerae bacterium]
MSIVIFETPRLTVRQYTEADAEQALEIYSDPEVMRFISMGKTGPITNVDEMRQNLIERRMKRYKETPQFGGWAAVAKDTGTIVGTIILLNLDNNPEIEVGWHLARSAWGKGYATEGGRGAIDHGFNVAGLDRIACVVHPDNHKSLAVARRLNLTHEGRRHYYNQDLEYFSTTRPTIRRES